MPLFEPPAVEAIYQASSGSAAQDQLLAHHTLIAAALTRAMSEHAYPLKTLGDAFHLRNQILHRLEEADQETDEALRKKDLTLVTIGAGYSGVETIAELHDMMKTVLPFYPRAARTGHRAILIHSGDRILHELDAGLSAFAQTKLEARGVQVRLRVRVKEVSDEGVTLSTGEMIRAGIVVCTVGNRPHPLVPKMGLSQEGGRIRTDEYLKITGTVNLWAVGDAALIPDLERGGVCPPTAQYATRQGAHCARNVLATIRGEALRPFRFEGVGQLASIGRRTAVGRVLGAHIAGFLAWLLWRAVYLAKVPGLRCKVRVATHWALDLLFPRDIAKIDLRRTEQLARAHYREGDVIVRQGESGDHFYIIESGQVEIIRENPGRTAEKPWYSRRGHLIWRDRLTERRASHGDGSLSDAGRCPKVRPPGLSHSHTQS